VLDPEQYPISQGVPRGAYVLAETGSVKPDVILIATGSEVHLALASRKVLRTKGIEARVVSMPSWELFEEQTKGYMIQILPSNIPKLAIEAGVTIGWQKYVGENGDVIGMSRFGGSGPGRIVYDKFGFNVDNVVSSALALLKQR
jgi:transketolase